MKERGQHGRNYFSSDKIVCLYAQLLVDIPGVFCISGCIVGELKETFPVHRRYFALIDELLCILNRKLLGKKWEKKEELG